MNDTFAGLLLIAAALSLIYAACVLPNVAGQPYGPGAFPLSVGLGLLFPSLLVLYYGAKNDGWPHLSFSDWVFEPPKLFRFLLVFASVLFYVMTVKTIGFVPIIFTMLLALMLVSGVSLFASFLASALTTVSAYMAFAVLLRVPLPRGTILSMIWG